MPSIIAAIKIPPITPATPVAAPVNPPKLVTKSPTMPLDCSAAPPTSVNGLIVSEDAWAASFNEPDKLFICLLALEDAWPASSRPFPNSDNGRLASLAAFEISDILLSIAPPSSLNSNVPQILNTSAIPSPP